jgi:hypothetical protein
MNEQFNPTNEPAVFRGHEQSGLGNIRRVPDFPGRHLRDNLSLDLRDEFRKAAD